jgi:uncharacterized membrane protein YwzB
MNTGNRSILVIIGIVILTTIVGSAVNHFFVPYLKKKFPREEA